MNARKESMRRGWRDPEDAPDLSRRQWRERLERADVMEGQKIVRRGRPPSEAPKVSTTIRLDADVIAHFRAGGRGWQTRLNSALRKAARL